MNEVTRPAANFAEGLMKLIADPSVSGDKLELLLKLQAASMETRAREEFNSDFALLSAELPQVERKGKVELRRGDERFGSYAYARWEDMDRAIRPIIAKHGFAITFSSFVQEQRTVLRGELLHTGGFSKTAEFPVLADKGPGRNDLQAIGSGLSYAKRYVAELLLNVVRKGEDDDAISAFAKKISAKQVEALRTGIAAAKRTPEKFLSLMVTGVDRLEDIPEREYARLLNACDQMIATANKKGKEQK